MEQDSNVNLTWDAHQSTLKSVFDTLLDSERLADCTIGAEGQHLKAHKLMLSACSQYFEVLFSYHCGKHVIIVLPGVQFKILKELMEFMYRGEVLVPQDDLDALLQLADFLQVKGLSYGGNVVSEKKQTHKRRTKSLRASTETYKHNESPKVLEVSGRSSHSEYLQKQDYAKVTPVSTPAQKRKKSEWHSSREEPPPQEDLVPPSHTAARNFPLTRLELPDKSKSTCGMLSEPGPSQRSKLPVFSEANFSEPTVSGQELISAKPFNSMVRTSIRPTVSEEATILETLVEPKQENCSGLNEDCVPEVILDSDDTQHPNTCNDNSFVTNEVTESCFSDGETFTQQMQSQQTEWSNMDTTAQTSAKKNRFKCQSCDRSYGYYSNLLRHLKYECGKEPQFQCSHCSSRFRHKHSLKEHMAIRHTHSLKEYMATYHQ